MRSRIYLLMFWLRLDLIENQLPTTLSDCICLAQFFDLQLLFFWRLLYTPIWHCLGVSLLYTRSFSLLNLHPPLPFQGDSSPILSISRKLQFEIIFQGLGWSVTGWGSGFGNAELNLGILCFTIDGWSKKIKHGRVPLAHWWKMADGENCLST